MPCHKVNFWTKDEAKREVKRHRGKLKSYYWCKECGSYHTTSMRKVEYLKMKGER